MPQFDPAEILSHSTVLYIIWAVIGLLALGALGYLIKFGIDQLIAFIKGLKEEFEKALSGLQDEIKAVKVTLQEILNFISAQSEKNNTIKDEIKSLWEDVEQQWEAIEEIKGVVNTLNSEHKIFHLPKNGNGSEIKKRRVVKK